MRIKFHGQGKDREPLMVLEFTADMRPPTTSQTRYPLNSWLIEVNMRCMFTKDWNNRTLDIH